MALGLVGIKCGMTRVFDAEKGASIPVSVLSILPNRIVQLKTNEKDGYGAVQVTRGTRKAKHLTKAVAGHFAKANVLAGKDLFEFRDTEEALKDLTVGSELTVELFQVGQMVDVTGITKGRGYTGVIQRHRFSSQRASHGNSISHNAPGSIGQNQTPGRVFPGKRMAGHYGDEQCTIQNLEVIRVDAEKQMLLVKGAIPGAPGGKCWVRPARKAKKQQAST